MTATDGHRGAGRWHVGYEEAFRALGEIAEKRALQLDILSEVAARIHGEDDVARILDVALEEILRRMTLRAAWVFVGTTQDRRLELAAHRGLNPRYVEALADGGAPECLCPEVFSSGHRMEVRNTTQCPRMPDIVDGLSVPVSHACVPLRFEGQSRGVLNVAAPPGVGFSDDELRFFETLGHQVCIAIERAEHRRAERRLHEDSRRAYQDLKDAQQRVLQAEKMGLLGTFASGLAHEIRNPLNSIALQLSILERRLAALQAPANAALAEIVEIIRGEIQRLDNLVGDFLLFSRTNRIQYAQVDVDGLVDEVMRLLEPEARTAGVALRRSLTGAPLPPLRVDGERMKQVVINLVRNAIEALAEAGRSGSVTIETGLHDGRARIVVRDDGPGLPQDLDVFQLFVTTKPKGTGLGLSIAQQIVLEHGGEIEAANAGDGGATIAISLPLERAGRAQEARTS